MPISFMLINVFLLNESFFSVYVSKYRHLFADAKNQYLVGRHRPGRQRFRIDRDRPECT